MRRRTASQHTSCAVRGDGSLWCWGLNAFHELSRPELDVEFHEPVQVGGDLDWAQVENGWFHTCGLKASGALADGAQVLVGSWNLTRAGEAPVVVEVRPAKTVHPFARGFFRRLKCPPAVTNAPAPGPG